MPAHRSRQTHARPEPRALRRRLPGACVLVLVLVLGVQAACGHAGLATASRDIEAPVVPGTILEAFSEAGDPRRFRIESVAPDPRDRDGDVSLYGVSVFTPSTGTWAPYCAPDPDGRSAAIPVQGSWSAQGELEPTAEMITFACTSGAIGKCIRFGYKPWKTHHRTSLQPYHAACMHMVRADYCGDGRPHTVDGTWIDIWDDIGIQTRDQRDGHPEVFEAAWSPGGAAYLNVPRWSDEVAEIASECPEHFAGRTSADRPLLPADVQRAFPDALIFNARYVRAPDRRLR
jgi:hypothetical protein